MRKGNRKHFKEKTLLLLSLCVRVHCNFETRIYAIKKQCLEKKEGLLEIENMKYLIEGLEIWNMKQQKNLKIKLKKISHKTGQEAIKWKKLKFEEHAAGSAYEK